MSKQRIPSDEELVRMVQEGCLEPFTLLYERYLPVVYNRVRYMIPQADVEDVTQEVFIAVMKSLKSFRGESQFHTWLRTLVNRQIADFYRRRSSDCNEIDLDIQYAEPERFQKLQVAENTTSIDDSIIIRQALRKLPEKYQEILLLRFADGRQFNEIAQMQGQSLEATKSLFRRAVAALHKLVEETETYEEPI